MKKTNNIINFDTQEQFEKYINSKVLTKKLGEGSEGVCYLSSKDNSVYKIMRHSLYEYTDCQRKLEDIITTQDIELKHFIMPKELYAISKKLIGYKTEYITPDLFDYYNLMRNYENIYKINFSALKKAYYQILKETEKLSLEKIRICDLSCNLMFTGKKLVAIDTCFYRRVNEEPLKKNIESLNDAIIEVFNSWIKYNPSFEENEIELLDFNQNQDIENYLTNVSKLTRKLKRKNF